MKKQSYRLLPKPDDSYRGRRSLPIILWQKLAGFMTSFYQESEEYGGKDYLPLQNRECIEQKFHAEIPAEIVLRHGLWDNGRILPNVENIRKLYNERA